MLVASLLERPRELAQGSRSSQLLEVLIAGKRHVHRDTLAEQENASQDIEFRGALVVSRQVVEIARTVREL
jgi:hypothetical protein